MARRHVAEIEPAERPPLQAERLHHHLRRDIFLHNAEDRRLVDLLLVVGLHRLGRQDPRADQRDREISSATAASCQFRYHQANAGDQFENGATRRWRNA